MIDDAATLRRWMVAVFAALIALVLHLAAQPSAGAAAHLPFFFAIAVVAMIGGRWPAALVLGAGLGVAVWRLFDGSTSLPEAPLVRFAVLSGYVVLGALLIAMGHTARRHAQDSRRAREELQLALAAAEVGSWNFDFASSRLKYSPNVGPLIGRPAGFVHRDLDEWRSDVHPDDLAELTRSLRASGNGESYEVRYRFRTPSGDWRWLQVRGRITRTAEGRLLRADGVVMDITGARRTELDLWRSSQELRTMLDLIPAGVAIAHDATGDRITVSPRFARMLGIDELTNASCSGNQRDDLPYRCMRGGVEIPGDEQPMQVAARTGREVHDCELDLVFDDGHVVHLLSSAAPLFDTDGKVRGAIGVHTDVTALKEAQRNLERMDRQKDIFLATLAHELRNPLAPIRYAAAMLRARTEAAVIDEAARIIERQSGQMRQLLDELLDMSRVTRDAIELRHELVDLNQVLRHEVESLRSQLAETSQSVDVKFEQSAWVLGDETRLHQIVANLLSNAAKYTPAGGRIEAALDCHEAELELRIRDNGIGIASADLPHVFDLFTQIRKPGAVPGSGLGIGLAVVRRLVQLHGGSIAVTSAGPGTGSTFTVLLPRAASPGETGNRQDSVPDAVGDGRRVLLCDDNVDATDTLAGFLRLHGFTVRVTYDGTSARRAAADFQPEIAVLDLGLPDIPGEDVARWIRGQPWGADVLLVAVTGWGQAHDRARTAAAGFTHHLVKPVEPQQLLVLLGARATCS
jgi:signal transduction histidine kinase